MNTYIPVLRIEDDKREELNSKSIVICSYNTLEEGVCDCISNIYTNEYPQFISVTAIIREGI